MAFDNPFKKLSKPQLYAVIGGSILLGGAYEYSHHKSAGTWNPFSKGTQTVTGSAIDPVTNLPVSEDDQIDPITNLPYLAEAQQYGSVSAAEASVSAFGASSNTGSGIGVSPASPGAASTTLAAGAVAASTYTSNAAWSQAAVAGLADIGYPESDVATAIGDVLQGVPVTSVQAGYYNTAVSEYGQPPQPVPPLTQVPVAKPSPTPPPPPPVNTVKVPSDLIGQSQEAAFAILTAAGLHAKGTPVVTGKTLIVKTVSPREGTTVNKGSTVTLTSQLQK